VSGEPLGEEEAEEGVNWDLPKEAFWTAFTKPR